MRGRRKRRTVKKKTKHYIILLLPSLFKLILSRRRQIYAAGRPNR